MTTAPRAEALAPPAGWRVVRHAVLGSTSDEARRLVEAGEAGPGLAVLADRQTAGRGRRGRHWAAGEGNLYLSAVLATDRPPAETGCFAFAVANAVWDAVAAETGLRPVLKWPNDVLLAGRKLAGILIEAIPPDGRRLVVGIGMNLAGVPGALRDRAVALAEACGGTAPDRDRMADAVLRALGHWHGTWQRAGAAPALAAMRARTVRPGTAVTVDRGTERVEGTYLDIAADGSLVVRDAGGREHRITTGDVALVGGPAATAPGMDTCC